MLVEWDHLLLGWEDRYMKALCTEGGLLNCCTQS
jgi:hypothetical protein